MVDSQHRYSRGCSGDLVVKLLVSVFDGDNFPAGSQIAEFGQPLVFEIESHYLVAAGQKQRVGISVFDADFIALTTAGPKADARHLIDPETDEPLVSVPITWDVSFIPSTRLLTDILAEAIQHGVDYPHHGINCACQDDQVREIRLQISKALPPDGCLTPEQWSGGIQERLNAKARVRAILEQVVRNL